MRCRLLDFIKEIGRFLLELVKTICYLRPPRPIRAWHGRTGPFVLYLPVSHDYKPPAKLTMKENLVCILGIFGFFSVFSILSFCFIVGMRSTRHIMPNSLDGISQLSSDSDILSFCRTYDFYPYRSGIRTLGIATHRKVYDLFLISDELDWLEIRLNTLAPYVDYFVIVESNKTLSGLSKPLYLKENWSRFAWFHSKIIHRVVEDPGAGFAESTQTHQDFYRDALLYSTFPTLVFTQKEAREGDILLVSDVDEIPKPETLAMMRHCAVPDRVTLRSHYYQNSFQWLHTGKQWAHPQATVFHGLETTVSPSHLRNGTGGSKSLWGRFVSLATEEKVDLWDAAWHCNACTNETVVEEREDMSEEARELSTRVENNTDVPLFVLDNPRRFGYMLD